MAQLLLAGCLALISAFAFAGGVQEEIAKVDKLNDLCRGGSGGSPATMRACANRDAAIAALEKRGWCFGHASQAMYEREWEPCNGVEPTGQPAPNGELFLAMDKRLLLLSQNQQCDDLGVAEGNQKSAARCKARIEKAYQWLKKTAYLSALPAPVWASCLNVTSYDVTMGARCVAAGRAICQADEYGQARDYAQCVRIMSTGAWVANPAAISLRF